MKKNFWKNLPRPFYALAPLAGISDSPFRQMCKDYGADVVYSEMASATALVYAPAKTLEMLRFEARERPYVIQLFGSVPDHFRVAAKLIETEIAPDGIDINFGCPVPKVAKQNAGAALFADADLSREIIKATIESTSLPVSIKTRTKSGETEILSFLESIRDYGVSAIMIHGRTLRQGFNGPADFEIIRKARSYFSGTIIANGGITDLESARLALEISTADGLGIARAAFGRPWIFKELKDGKTIQAEASEIFKVMKDHAELFLRLKGQAEFVEMRKHFAWYVQGFPGAKALREKLIQVSDLNELIELIKVNSNL
jgi:tRNA-dihydrouridine synthase B